MTNRPVVDAEMLAGVAEHGAVAAVGPIKRSESGRTTDNAGAQHGMRSTPLPDSPLRLNPAYVGYRCLVDGAEVIIIVQP